MKEDPKAKYQLKNEKEDTTGEILNINFKSYFKQLFNFNISYDNRRTCQFLVGGLEHFFIFHNMWDNYPN